MKLAVVGSRGFTNRDLAFSVLDIMYADGEFDHIISGGAKGADSFAEHWALQNDVPSTIMKPDWKRYGKSAGFKRNVEIWNDADFGVAFWDGVSKGTAHSFSIAKAQEKKLIIVNYVTGDVTEQ